MTRWTEDDLASFQRNSGRALPSSTVRAVERANLRQLPAHLKDAKVAKRLSKIDKDEQRAKDEQAAAKAKLEPAKKRKARSKSVPVPTATAMPQSGAAFAHRGGHKYHAQATVVDGIRFDSKLESERYKELKLEVAGGNALYFLRQVPFHLPGGIRYVVDFMIVRPMTSGDPNNLNALRGCVLDYEDCKGVETADGRNKIKQVFSLYGVTVQLVKRAGGRRSRRKRK